MNANGRRPLTIREAVQVTGLSDKTIRRALDAGDLQEAPGSRDAMINGTVLISPESIEALLAKAGRRPRGEVRGSLPVPQHDAPLMHAISVFGQTIQDAQAQVFTLQRRVAELEAERRYLVDRAEVERLQRELDEAHAEIRRLTLAAGEV